MPVRESFESEEAFHRALRDWFAGQALAGIAQAANGDRVLGFLEHKDLVAEYAYACADAMLAQRDKGGGHD